MSNTNEFDLGLIVVDLGSLEEKVQLVVQKWVNDGSTFSGKNVKDALREVYIGAKIEQDRVSRAVHRVMGKYAVTYQSQEKTAPNGERYIEYSPKVSTVNKVVFVAKSDAIAAIDETKMQLQQVALYGTNSSGTKAYRQSRVKVVNGRKIAMWEMDSTALYDAGYDVYTNMLIVSYTSDSNKVYVYNGIPALLWTRLLNAESRGEFFHQNIKSKYQSEAL